MNDHIRLLILSENYPPEVGGSARWLGEIARYWMGEVHVISARRNGFKRQEATDRGLIQRRRFDFPSWAPDTLRSMQSFFQWTSTVLREVAKLKPELILCGRCMPEGIFARLACHCLGVPYACLIHGEEIGTCNSSGLLRKQLQWVLGGACMHIANSENSKSLAIQAGAPPSRCSVVHPGVMIDEYTHLPERDDLRKQWDVNGPVILSVGRLEWRKNHVMVVRALAQLIDRGLDATYMIAGTGEQRYAIASLAECLGIQDHVRLLGRVPQEDLPGLYHLADVFALPGIGTDTAFEGFGIVFLEAAAAGTPSIAGNAGGSSEAVIHGQTGLVVDGEGLAAITQALESLLSNNTLRLQMGQAARNRARAEFNWPTVVGQLARELQASLSKREQPQ